MTAISLPQISAPLCQEPRELKGSFSARELSLDTMLPDLLAVYPQARVVFDRYGLRGCGGTLGPVESIGFFSRTHGVPQDQLLSELRLVIAAPRDGAVATVVPSIGDAIYRRFFTAGIILILTAGATWGAWLLWRIGFAGKFTGISIHDVNAHGHAQIYGWVGLFIMGFAYQAFPRIWHTDLVTPRLAVAGFVSMVVGLIVRTIGMALTGTWHLALPAALLGGGLEIASILIFVSLILATFARGQGKLEPYVGFAIMALIFFVAMSFVDIWHTYTTMSAATPQDLIWYISTYQAPLRDLQIHGVALLMILGVCMRMLPALYGVRPVPHGRAWTALCILTAAVLGEVGIFIAYRWSGNHALAALLMVPWLMLVGGVAMVALPWRMWRAFPENDRSAKFIRAGYGWLVISLVMLLMLPAYQVTSGIPFSHAYYGSIRHAITVGFISLMIMGFAGKVVPTLNGLDVRRLSPLWGPFILVNTGCFLRVSLQTLTDWHPIFFSLVGVSGMLEVTGLAWWGIGLVRIMRRGKREMAALEDEALAAPPERIGREHRVTDILRWFPDTARVFDRFGFTLLRQPLLRRTLARGVNVAAAARFKSVPEEEFLAAINHSIATIRKQEEPQINADERRLNSNRIGADPR